MINEIIHLIKEKENVQEYQFIIDFLENEIKNPLHDLNEQNFICNELKRIKLIYKEINENNINCLTDKNKLIDLFLKNNYSINIFEKLLMEFSSSLDILDFKKIGQVFIDKTLKNDAKIIFLNLLNDYDLKYKFSFYNAKTKEIFYVSNNDKIKPNEILFWKKILLELDNIFLKDISKSNLAKNIVFSIFEYFFLTYLFEYKNDNLSLRISEYINFIFDNNLTIDKKFFIFIQNILN